MLPSFCNQNVTVYRPAYVTTRGASVPDWASAATSVIRGCSVQPASSSTSTGEQRVNPTTYDATLYAPPGSDVRRGDRVSCDGVTFDVDGVPLVVTSPTGRVSHVRANLVARQG